MGKGTPLADRRRNTQEQRKVPERKPETIEYIDDMEQYSDILDDDGQDELDETYNVVYALVEDDEELALFVSAIEHCGNFKGLPGNRSLLRLAI